MRQTSIRNDIRLFIVQGYHWVDMRRASSDISQAANAIVARATATPMNQRECEYHPSGEGGATPTKFITLSLWPFMPRCPSPQT